MYATMHQYAGITPAVFDRLMSHEAEIETLQRCAWELSRVRHWGHESLLRIAGSSAAAAFCSRASTNRPAVVRIRR
jgi:hypothetical protein